MKKKLKLTTKIAATLILIGNIANLSYSMEYLNVFDSKNEKARMSRLIMGTAELGKMDEDKALNLLNKARDLGINTFDTSPIYLGSENVLFKWLSQQKDDTNFFVITKGGFAKEDQNAQAGTYGSILRDDKDGSITKKVNEEVQGSIDRLDNVSNLIFLLHRDDRSFEKFQKKEGVQQTSVKAILEGVSQTTMLKEKCRMFGVSNWSDERVAEALMETKATDKIRPTFNSPYFSLLEMDDNSPSYPGVTQVKHDNMTKSKSEYQKDIKLITYSPLGGYGPLLSGDWDFAKAKAEKSKNVIKSDANWQIQEYKDNRYLGGFHDSIFSDANKGRFERALKLSARLKCSIDQTLNAYVLAHPRTDFVVIGPLDTDQLERSVESLKIAGKLKQDNLLEYLYSGKIK